MIALGFRVSLIGSIVVGLAACSAAGQSPPVGSRGGEDSEAVPSAQQGSDRSDLPRAPSTLEGGDVPGSAGASNTNGGDAGNGAASCACGIRVPGIEIVQGDAGIQVVVDLPGDGSMIIATVDGYVMTSQGGVDITGNVDVDLGGDETIALDKANLHVDAVIDDELPMLSGTADISGQLLGPACGCGSEPLPATITIGEGIKLDTTAGDDTGPALAIDVNLPRAILDGSPMAQANGDLAIDEAHVRLDTDGSHDALVISGTLAGSKAPWASDIPLGKDGSLGCSAKLIDQKLINVELTGAVTLKGDSLWCGVTPVASVKLADAKVTLGRSRTNVAATTQTSLLPDFTLQSAARVTATFEARDWSINVCGAVMTKLLGASADASTCLDLSHEGVKPCPKTTPN